MLFYSDFVFVIFDFDVLVHVYRMCCVFIFHFCYIYE